MGRQRKGSSRKKGSLIHIISGWTSCLCLVRKGFSLSQERNPDISWGPLKAALHKDPHCPASTVWFVVLGQTSWKLLPSLP